MTIEKILSLPEMVRSEEDSGYVYPEEYQDKLFAFDGKYVLLRKNTNESLPKELTDRIIENKLENFDIEVPPVDLATDEHNLQLIDERISNSLAESFNNINRVIDNINDKLGSTLELKHLQEYRHQVESTINNMFEERGKVLEGFDVDEFLKDFNTLTTRFDEIEKTINDINTQDVQSNEIDVKQMISEELEIVHKNLPGLVQEIVSKCVNTKNTTGQSIAASSKLSLGQLVTLKESGYSVKEIKELKEEGLI